LGKKLERGKKSAHRRTAEFWRSQKTSRGWEWDPVWYLQVLSSMS